MTDRKIIYITLCFGCITISFSVAAISAIIPAMSLDLHLNDLLVSKVIPFYMIPYGIGALIYAPLTKYFSYRRILSVSIFLYALSCLFGGLSKSLDALLFARIAMGATGAAIIPLGLMMIGDLFEKNIRGRLLGGFFSCSFFASLTGVAVGGIASWRWIFLIPAIIGSATAVSFFLLKNSKGLNKIHGVHVDYGALFTNLKIRNIFIFIFIISALYHGVHKWYGVYFSRIYAMEKLQISLFFIVSAIAGFCGQLLGGYLSDRKGRLFACYIGLIGLSLGTMALAGTYNLFGLGLIVSIISMSWTIGHNGVSTALTDFPDQERPVIASLNSSVRFIAGGIGFYISSLFVSKSFSETFFIIGILMLLLTLPLKQIVKS